MVTFQEARQRIFEQVSKKGRAIPIMELSVWDAHGYVLAQDIAADRDYPPFDRATRDGYAVRAAQANAGAALACVGEIKAGDDGAYSVAENTCVQIMTGAPVPADADAVVMVEFTRSDGETVRFERDAAAGQNIVPRGSESRCGQKLVNTGTRLGFAELALAAQVGATQLRCAKKPRVAILSTGDELVAVDAEPGTFQIRNSNSVSLAAQVATAGGEPVVLAKAGDSMEELREAIRRGLNEDILVLSGGVSMGKYDLVEDVLREFGAEFLFDAVAIRPGKPAVFAMIDGKPVFGLPGNPLSTMVTFELFVVPAIDMLSGASPRPLAFLGAALGEPLHEKLGMTHFLPASVSWRDGTATVRAIKWKGSGDTVSMAQANCFLVVGAEVENLAAGADVEVWMRRDVL
jgi:molybdopterin molybdotransferase